MRHDRLEPFERDGTLSRAIRPFPDGSTTRCQVFRIVGPAWTAPSSSRIVSAETVTTVDTRLVKGAFNAVRAAQTLLSASTVQLVVSEHEEISARWSADRCVSPWPVPRHGDGPEGRSWTSRTRFRAASRHMPATATVLMHEYCLDQDDAAGH